METASYYQEGEEKFGSFSSRFYSLFSGMHYWKYYRTIVGEILKFPPGTALDVGCGPGDILVHLAAENNSIRLSGVDPSEGMVKSAKRKIVEKGLAERVTVESGSSRDIPFNTSFDLIFSSMSFHHWKGREPSLRNLSRHLTESGRIIIFDLDRDQYPGKLPLVKRHSLSEDECMKIDIKGFSKEVKHLAGTGLISFSLYREQDGK